MFTTHFKIAVRNMLKHKGYTFINVAGLTMGITVCLLIFLWVRDELCYDRFNAKADRTYRALWEARFGDNEWKIPLGPVPLAEALTKEFPEVEQVVRLYRGGFTLRHGDDFVREQNVVFAEESFFEVFTVSFISGNPATALRDPEAVVLTAEAAQRYFPNQNPLGQTLSRNDGKLLRVTGVVKSFPPQAHFDFAFLAPLKTLPRFEQRQQQWGSASVYTYLVLRPGENIAALQTKLQAYLDKNVSDENFQRSGNYSRFPMQPLLDIHLRSHLKYELAANGNIAYIYLFAAIACFILLLACINFVNLATARSMNRSREVGIRKVLGSQRLQLVRQFLAESFAHVALAMGLAMVLAELVLPTFNRFAGKALTINFFDSPFVATLLAGLAVVVTALAGTYPALFLSSFWPVQVLKGGVTIHSGRDWLRQGLVVVQFCISIGLIVGTLVVRNQLDFIQNKRLGFDKEHVLMIHRASALRKQFATFRDRLISHPLVVDASAAQNLPGQEFDSTVFLLEQPANYQQTSLTYDSIDEHYVNVLQLKIVEGRNFSTEFATDSSAFLINQAAAKAFGWKEPLGKRLSMGDFIQGPVIGVVEDFHFESLHHEVKPILFFLARWEPAYFAVRLHPGNLAEGISAIQNLWKEFVPNTPFEYSFLDQDYQKLYESEQRVARVFMTFSVLAILIACLGLLGLASFTAEQRTKEIGIRKVLGASVAGVIGLLSKEFVKLVLMANVVAWPLAYFAMNKWLQDFAYRISIGWPREIADLHFLKLVILDPTTGLSFFFSQVFISRGWGVFALAGGLALAIALLTVSFQSIKAALANPAEALRYE